MKLWKREATLEQLNAYGRDTLVGTLGIVMTDIGEDYLRATMPVDERTRQPFGLLHGGASVALAETLGSLAAWLCLDDPENQLAVGLDINANHVRGIRSGQVTGTARPDHIGRSTQVWTIRIVDEADRLVCVSRLTVSIVPRAG